MSATPRVLSLCADDFGLTPALSRRIADLAERGRLTAVSCLTGGVHWPASAAWLAGLPPAVDRGLHFNLTEGEPASAELRRHWPRWPALPALIVAAHRGRLPLAAIACEWRVQWQRFIDATGTPPRFVDGHQHVHHLPGVREVMLQALAGVATAVAVRNTGWVIGPGNAFKRWLIAHSGGTALQRALRQCGREHNRALLGVYGFDDADYGQRMQRWLAAAPAEGGLLFCHPGAVDDSAAGPSSTDAIAAARLREAAYLGSAAFVDDLAAAGITLGAAWRQRPSAD